MLIISDKNPSLDLSCFSLDDSHMITEITPTDSAHHRASQAFGRNLVALVSPMQSDGTLCRVSLQRLVTHLLDHGCDGLVVNGTTGESPTITDDELGALIGEVATQAAGRARVIAGVGTYDTAHTLRRAQLAESAGADGLLLVAPYYSKPTQKGMIAHLTAAAEATTLPVMLYDIPGRTGAALDAETLRTLAHHPRILAVKDAKGNLNEAMTLMHSSPLAYYCGIDELNLPYLACGASGLVSVVGNVVPQLNRALLEAIDASDLPAARRTHAETLPLTHAMMGLLPGTVTAKAALAHLGILTSATVRAPLVEADPEELITLHAALGGVAPTQGGEITNAHPA
ncbi:pyrimidine-nucleoside phosphorylase [Platysternon megacephalum]|uniref:4-hydroxy-2-oxoglutarate aldolase, mitochondrial n=1 Tax=Platysternon megacephalum TaxID=55544 RepID=A0A4D9DDI9_9SAUR|nr:pyrimidine-nucleoside phosphorylase [Platysternon megacephalum]